MTQESTETAPVVRKRFWKQFENANPALGKLAKKKNGRVLFDIDERGQILSKVLMGETHKKGVYVELLLEEHDQETNKYIYTNLEQDREIIDAKLDSSLGWKKLGLSLTWNIGSDTIRSKIFVHNKNFNPRDETHWENQYKWILETTEAFDSVFTKRLQEMKISQ